MYAVWNVMSHNLDSPFHKSIASGIDDVPGSLARIDDEDSLVWTNTTNRQVLTSRKRVLIVCMRYEGEDRLETHIDACNMIDLLVRVKSQAEITVLTDCHATAQLFQSYPGVQVIHSTSAERISATLDSMHREKHALLCLFGHGDRGPASSREPKGHEQLRVGQGSAVTDEVIGRLMEAWQHSNNVVIIGTCRAEGLLTAKRDTSSVFKATASRGIGPAVMDSAPDARSLSVPSAGSFDSSHASGGVATYPAPPTVAPTLYGISSDCVLDINSLTNKTTADIVNMFKERPEDMAILFSRTRARLFDLEEKYQRQYDRGMKQVLREKAVLEALDVSMNLSAQRLEKIQALSQENEQLRAELEKARMQIDQPAAFEIRTTRELNLSNSYDENHANFKRRVHEEIGSASVGFMTTHPDHTSVSTVQILKSFGVTTTSEGAEIVLAKQVSKTDQASAAAITPTLPATEAKTHSRAGSSKSVGSASYLSGLWNMATRSSVSRSTPGSTSPVFDDEPDAFDVLHGKAGAR